MSEPLTMGFLDHLRELRRRLLIAVTVAAAGTLMAWPYSGAILELLMKPVLKFLPDGQGLKFFALPEAFSLNLKISLWAGLIATSPVTLYQLWAFCAPGLKQEEKRRVPALAALATFLLLLGTSFAYFLVWPVTFGFFLGFSSPVLQPMLDGSRYISLALSLVAVFALTFQLPLILMFLGRLGLITAQMLKKFRRYAVVIFFIIGAVLTPPDALSQCFLALTLIFLYELSIILIGPPKKEEPQGREDEPEADISDRNDPEGPESQEKSEAKDALNRTGEPSKTGPDQ
ncbi:MAG: twin-arginine translocase subunit TatC [Deltaproteobacteria bacterium]|jgi:sec-independent protein translocase protein TatC|nr:twin-arginine translocase subunit TatC [Deltaproteobacteria bacterium]